MAKLTQEMKDLIAAQQCYVATVNPDGTPNVGPKRSTRVLDDEHIVFNEGTGRQTWGNIERGSKVAIAVADRDKLQGYRFLGTPEAIVSGSLYDEAAAMMQQLGVPPPKAVIKVKIDKIYNLGVPGAGEEIL
ncbi:MAG: pyridoxamine 5'-phosphate oxidase family protein [Chloroflexota bacterium]|nr:pyridoxamine 5'-phosphate oxidase family protein [Chloroflexota bacterium]